MTGDIIHYHTIQELYKTLGVPLKDQGELVVFRLEDVYTKPNSFPVSRANYYSILIIKSGSGSYSVDDQSYETKARTIYFTNPGHLKHFQVKKPYQGFMISFSENFLQTNVRKDIYTHYPFLLAEVVPPHYLSIRTFSVFRKLGEAILAEHRRSSPIQQEVIGNYLDILLLKIKDQFWKGYTPREEADSGSRIIHSFKALLETRFANLTRDQKLPSATELADALSLHPNYLNAVIKTKTGKPVSTWINEKTILEAKALLERSSLPVKNISYFLKFSEPTHFNRFFKKHTGYTPAKYRASLR